jgi:hypothetical protein
VITAPVDLASAYLADSLGRFEELRALGGKTIARLSDDQLAVRLDPESNSVALVMKHMAGNMRSRWTDFLTSDGEKPDRNRDSEFEDQSDVPAAELRRRFDAGWELVLATVRSLRPEDLTRTVLIRTEPHTVLAAINRQLTHYGYHTGQIIFIAKHLASGRWESLSVPRGGSEAFNRRKAG